MVRKSLADSRNVCMNERRKELAQMRMIQEKFPHRHISHLKAKGDWTPPPTSKSDDGTPRPA